MGKYVAENIVKALIKEKNVISEAEVAILGFTFKENCQDTRNTKVIDIIKELQEFGVKVIVVDDIADAEEAKQLYDVEVIKLQELKKVDAIAVCVQHEIFKSLKKENFDKLYKKENKILFDLKGIYNNKEYEDYFYWRL